MKNQALSFGVVQPPNQLPTTTLYDTVYSQEYRSPNQPSHIEEIKESNKGGKFGAGCGIAAIALTALSFLPFIRRH